MQINPEHLKPGDIFYMLDDGDVYSAHDLTVHLFIGPSSSHHPGILHWYNNDQFVSFPLFQFDLPLSEHHDAGEAELYEFCLVQMFTPLFIRRLIHDITYVGVDSLDNNLNSHAYRFGPDDYSMFLLTDLQKAFDDMVAHSREFHDFEHLHLGYIDELKQEFITRLTPYLHPPFRHDTPSTFI